MRKHDVKTVDDEAQLQASIFGVEKKPLPHLLCTTNMILHGIDVPNNIHTNWLRRCASPSTPTSLRMMSWMDLMEAERDMVKRRKWRAERGACQFRMS